MDHLRSRTFNFCRVVCKALLERMDPKDSGSPMEWLHYYEAGKIFGDDQVKRKAIDYLSGLADMPVRARIALALAIYTTEPEKAGDLLKGESGGAEEILMRVYQDLRKNSKSPKAYIGSLEFITHYVSSVGGVRSDAFSSYVKQILEQCIKMKRAGKKGVSSPYATIEKKNKDLISQRDKACAQFLRSAMNFKKSADSAFKVYLKDVPRDQKFSDAIITMVKDSLLATTKVNDVAVGYGFSMEVAYAVVPYRQNYLAQAVSFKKDNSLLDDVFLAKIKQLDNVLYGHLEAYRKLLLASGDLILKEMTALNKDADIADFTSWLNVLSLKSDQKIDLQFAEYFLAYLKNSKGKLDHSGRDLRKELSDLIAFSLNSLCKNKKHMGLLDYVDSLLAESVKGLKQDKVKAWVEIIHNSNFKPQDIDDYVVVLMMGQIMKHPALLTKGIKLAQKYQYPIDLSVRYDRSSCKIYSDLYERLLDAGYLNSAAKMKLTKIPIYKLKSFSYSSMAIDVGGLELEKKIFEIEGEYKMSYDAQYLAEYLYSNGNSSSNSLNMKLLVAKLQKAPKENKYGAALFLTLIREKTFDSFIKEHATSLKKAPKEHLALLQVIFELDTSILKRGVLKSNNIEDLFPIGRAAP